jgi:hypothetical protein
MLPGLEVAAVNCPTSALVESFTRYILYPVMGDPLAEGATQVTETVEPVGLASTDEGTPGTFVELTEAN